MLKHVIRLFLSQKNIPSHVYDNIVYLFNSNQNKLCSTFYSLYELSTLSNIPIENKSISITYDKNTIYKSYNDTSIRLLDYYSIPYEKFDNYKLFTKHKHLDLKKIITKASQYNDCDPFWIEISFSLFCFIIKNIVNSKKEITSDEILLYGTLKYLKDNTIEGSELQFFIQSFPSGNTFAEMERYGYIFMHLTSYIHETKNIIKFNV